MTCSACQDKPHKKCNSCGTLPPVLQINNEECPVIFHTIEVEGTSKENPPEIGQYKNVLLVYKGDRFKYLFNSDGIPSLLTENAEIYFDNVIDRPKYAGSEMTSETSIPDVNAAVSIEENRAKGAEEALGQRIDGIVVPTKTSALVNDGADGTSTYVEADELAEVATSGSYTDLTNTPVVDTALSTSSQNAIQNKAVSGALDRAVDTALAVDPNASTTILQLKETQTNLMTGVSVTNSIPLPVASTTQAGVMNSATFDAITNNTNNINALLNGAVAITGLSANPTQSELTTAWMNATGLSTLMNRAGIYDVTNSKVWTYYVNDTTWHGSSNGSTVVVNQFSNNSLGTIMGSTNTGQIFAENDGTGSVNGWDTLSGQVSTNTSKLSTIAQGAEVNVQSNWNEADSASDAFILNKPANLVQDANYVHTDNNFTTTLKDKLDGIEAGAEVNVQADLDQTDTTADDFVKNQFVKRYQSTSSQSSYGAGYIYLGSMAPNDNGANFFSIELEGHVGGFNQTSDSYEIKIALANRTKAMAIGYLIGPGGTKLGGQFDIVAYQDTNATTGERTRWYLHQITSFAATDITVRYHQPSNFNDKWDFTKSATTPSGVKVYSLTEDIQNGGTNVLWFDTQNGSISTINQVPSSTVGNSSRPVYLNNGVITATNQQSSGNNWDIVPRVTGQGVMEVGKYIDFHLTADGTTDNDGRLELSASKILRFGGAGADIQALDSDGTSLHSLKQALQNGRDVVSVGASSGTWSKDFDSVVFPGRFGVAILTNTDSQNIWANAPGGITSSTEHFYLEQIQKSEGSNSDAIQIAHTVNGSDGDWMWYRSSISGSWGNWVKLVPYDKSNSVNTNMIQDGAVTTAKLAGPKIIAAGTITFGSVPQGDTDQTISLGTTLPNTNYQVLLQNNGAPGDNWGAVTYAVVEKTTTSFKVRVFKGDASATVSNFELDYIVAV